MIKIAVCKLYYSVLQLSPFLLQTAYLYLNGNHKIYKTLYFVLKSSVILNLKGLCAQNLIFFYSYIHWPIKDTTSVYKASPPYVLRCIEKLQQRTTRKVDGSTYYNVSEMFI